MLVGKETVRSGIAVAICRKLMMPQMRFMVSPRATERKKFETTIPYIVDSIFFIAVLRFAMSIPYS
jgi:hypothetical protein